MRMRFHGSAPFDSFHEPRPVFTFSPKFIAARSIMEAMVKIPCPPTPDMMMFYYFFSAFHCRLYTFALEIITETPSFRILLSSPLHFLEILFQRNNFTDRFPSTPIPLQIAKLPTSDESCPPVMLWSRCRR